MLLWKEQPAIAKVFLTLAEVIRRLERRPLLDLGKSVKKPAISNICLAICNTLSMLGDIDKIDFATDSARIQIASRRLQWLNFEIHQALSNILSRQLAFTKCHL